MAAEIVADVEELPKAIVRRVVKEKLSQLSDDGDISVHKDALLAFSESARIFIHYLSATANDICRDSKRQTINADDVLNALEEIEFSEFTGPLKASLDEFRKRNAGKRALASKEKEETRKKKKEELPVKNGEDESNQDEEHKASDDEEHKASEDEEHKAIEDEEHKASEDEKHKASEDEEHKASEDEEHKAIEDEDETTVN